MAAAAPRWQASITRDATTHISLSQTTPADIKTREHEIRREALQVPTCGVSPNDHTCVQTGVCITHGRMASALKLWLYPSAHCSIEVLGYAFRRYHTGSTNASCLPDPGEVGLLCITLKPDGEPKHLPQLLRLPQASQNSPPPPLGCPHRSALWLSPVLSVPQISSKVKCKLAGPFILH